MSNKGLLFIISAPGGTGKTTLIEKLQKELPRVEKSVTYTTRKPRENEKNDKDYHFISEKVFLEKIEQGEMLEHTKLFDAFYGVSKKDVETRINQGIHVFLVIDVKGAETVRKERKAISIFLLPPSLEELQSRLQKREGQDQKSTEDRLLRAKEEMEHCLSYDYNIVNDNLTSAYDALRSIVIAEEHKVRNKDEKSN